MTKSIITTLLSIVWLVSGCRRQIREYQHFQNADVKYNGNGIPEVVAGHSHVLVLKEGVGASKVSTAHAHWTTIYLVLDKPVVGDEKNVETLFVGGYYRRSSSWAVDPDRPSNFVVKATFIDDKSIEFEITGNVAIRRWQLTNAQEKFGCKKGKLGDNDILWMPQQRDFQFKEGSYSFETTKLNED